MTWNFSKSSSQSQIALVSQVIKLSQSTSGFSTDETFEAERSKDGLW